MLDELYARVDAGDVGDGYTEEMAYSDLYHEALKESDRMWFRDCRNEIQKNFLISGEHYNSEPK